MIGEMNYAGVLVIEVCCNCHIQFAMPRELYQRLKERGGTFYCPNGHGQHYTATEVQRLKKELAQERESKEYFIRRNNALHSEKQAVERRLSAQKGQVTKIKKRIGNGVCPCCQRHFSNVERHMKTKHPDYTNSAEG